MNPGRDAAEKIYRAIVYIEGERIPSLKAYSRTITSFVRGTELSPYYSIYKAHPDVCGSLKKAGILDVAACCDGLAADGFLIKHENGDKILYSTSHKDYLVALAEKSTADENDSFYQKISLDQKTIIDSFVEHYRKFWVGISCLDLKNYFGFKATYFSGVPNHYWFWLSIPEDSLTHLKIKARISPKDNTVCFEAAFDVGEIGKIIERIDKILESKSYEFQLKHEMIFDNQNPANESAKKIDQPLNASDQVSSSLAETDHFNLRKYCQENCDFFFNDGKTDPTDALLLAGESSPFAFTKSTIYGPFLEMKKILKDAKYFDFSIHKWKIVAWSTLHNDCCTVQDVLFIEKKAKSIWLLINVPNKIVKIFTKWGFYLDTPNGMVSSRDFLGSL
jgi:hypothetical protein